MARIPIMWIPETLALEDLDRLLPRLADDGPEDGGEFMYADLRNDERTPALIAVFVWHGVLPMASMGYLLPKIHKARCILAPQDVHIGRKVKRRAKGFHLTIDTAWPVVVQHIQRLTFTSHEGDCWLSDELASAYAKVSRVAAKWRRGGVGFHSVELWHTETGELVAGEIGYTCGSMYSSCTGFTMKDRYPGAGSIQLCALGRWLERCGFHIWDLGMGLDYKLELGGKLVSRSEWAKRVRTHRTTEVALVSPTGLDGDAHLLVAAEVPQRLHRPASEVKELVDAHN